MCLFSLIPQNPFVALFLWREVNGADFIAVFFPLPELPERLKGKKYAYQEQTLYNCDRNNHTNKGKN